MRSHKRKSVDFSKPIATDIWLSGYPADLYVTEDCNGYFHFPHDGNLKAKLAIGIKHKSFWKVRRIVFHELFEAQASEMRLRYQPTNTLHTEGSDGTLFVIHHNQLSEVIAWVSDAWDVIEQRLLKAWRQYHRQNKNGR